MQSVKLSMGVITTPYEDWELGRSEQDYRSDQTQASSYTRNLLSQADYLRCGNRVNPGPSRNTRALNADSKSQVPHNLCNEDIWGYQKWTEPRLSSSSLAPELLEEHKVCPVEEVVCPAPVPTLDDVEYIIDGNG